MRRLFLLVVVLGVFLFALVVLMLGAFPPDPRPHAIQKVLPNDRFQQGAPGAPPAAPAPPPAGQGG